MITKILVVDDEMGLQLLIKQRFRHRIHAGDYSFLFALSGREALTILRRESDIDVILLDINMPDMSGLALLAQLNEINPTCRAVMVSAYGDMTNVRTAMNRGAFDFVIKPINFQDLELTIEKTARHVSQLRESIRVKSVADLKARFFDNITHEFRTPLSLIIAPTETLLQQEQHSEATRSRLLTVRKNAHHLLHLINQLLDLAKLEAESLPLMMLKGDAVAFLEQVVDSFVSYAEQKGLKLTFNTNVLNRESVFDADKWQKILTNLLSNAVKFTPTGGYITVDCSIAQDNLILTVTDTGIGIAGEHIPYIFDRFYQADTSLTRAYEGSGIGLALAYELTRRVGGHLSVSSVPSGGTAFKVELPLAFSENSYVETQLVPTSVEMLPDVITSELTKTESEPPNTDLPLLLLVEDNIELRTFMAESLAENYTILTASNGREGFTIAREELPDIVVSDVMMPEIDGYQLTDELKRDPITDHIAIILLTAKASADNRLTGLKKGADDYLSKPFNLDELRLRLRNMVNRQQKLRNYFHRQFSHALSLPSSVEEVQNPSEQELFLTKLNNLIEAHLDDSAFRGETLADEVAMSLRTLTRKLTMLAGVSPARFIRLYRLQRATQFLRAGHPVSETAYMVGFEHPANFATAFKEVFHQTPTEFSGR